MIENPYVKFVFIAGGEQIAKKGPGDKKINFSSEGNSNLILRSIVQIGENVSHTSCLWEILFNCYSKKLNIIRFENFQGKQKKWKDHFNSFRKRLLL